MKIVFIGAIKFSESCLKKMIELDIHPVAVCTLEKSNFNSDHSNLNDICKKGIYK